jgi:hypothetical protein
MSTIRGLINNFSTTLTSGINSSVTTIPVASVAGVVTELATSDFVPMTLDDGINIEIIHVTSVSGTDLIATRGREGSTANTFATATPIQCRLTRLAIMDSHEWRPVEVRTLGADAATVDFVLTDFPGVDQKVHFNGVTITSDTANVLFQQMTGAAVVQTTTYYHSGNYMTYSAGSTNNAVAAGSQMTLLPGASNATFNTIEGYFEMCIPSSNIRHTAQWLLSQVSKHSRGTGIRDVTEIVTGFRFLLSGGNFRTGSKFVRYVRSH